MLEMNYSELTKSQRWELADKLAATRLPDLNLTLEDPVPNENIYSKHIKRMVDVVVSGVALVVTLPINLALGIGTLLDVGRPIFFKQTRTGKDARTFEIIKFRNMKNEYDERGELLPASERVTKFGRFVRRTSLDELLNFWSIFKGDMSLIGPRPLVPEYTHRLNKRHRARTYVRPGLECPPRGAIEAWGWQEQFDNDVWYVENVSFRTDMRMFLNLVRFTFNREASRKRSSALKGTFMGYDLDGHAMTLPEISDECIGQLLDEER